MGTSLLGLNTYNTSFSLNNDLIEKLKTAELNSLNSPINSTISKINSSLDLTNQFKTKLNELLNLTKTEISNFTASTSNSNILFDAPNEELLKEGTYSFEVFSLAKKDVYSSNTLFKSLNDLFGDTNISIKGNNIDTTGKTVNEVLTELNSIEGVNANFENVSTTDSKLVIKSVLSGTDNSLNINSTEFSNVQSATNLKINIEGVEHQYNENNISYEGLTINVMKEGQTNLYLKEDTTNAKLKFDNIISKYNELSSFANDSILFNNNFSANKSAIKETMKTLKDTFFSNNLFQQGLELDKNGLISLKTELPNNTINSFINDMNNKLKDITSSTGNLNSFITKEENDLKNKNDLMQTNINNLDKKYKTLSEQFSAYNSLISSFEANFSSLKQMILYQTSGK